MALIVCFIGRVSVLRLSFLYCGRIAICSHIGRATGERKWYEFYRWWRGSFQNMGGVGRRGGAAGARVGRTTVQRVRGFKVSGADVHSVTTRTGVAANTVCCCCGGGRSLFSRVIASSVRFTRHVFRRGRGRGVAMSSLFSGMRGRTQVHFGHLRRRGLCLLLLSSTVGYSSRFSRGCASKLGSVLSRTTALFTSTFTLSSHGLTRRFTSVFVTALSKFTVRRMLRTVPRSSDSCTSAVLSFFAAYIPCCVRGRERS